MARQKGMLNLSGNLEPLAGAPLDSRSITPTVADLYIASNWPYKYIGMKTTVTATGDTYRLVNLDVTQESSWVKEGGESGQTIQYDELPAASSSLAGKIYQYTGTTNLQYTNGYFYECVNDGGTYKWVQTNTQPGTSYNDFTGATDQEAGAHGLVPAPTTGDISKFLKGDGTWATVPVPSFDYSNTSPEAMNFSTDEKVIGTWIDGKPLYQKTWEFTDYVELSSTNWYTTNISNSNIQNIVYSKATNSGGTCWSVSANCDSGSYVQLLAIRDNSGFAIKYLTLQYTKTTDTAVASGEKIVGQWIDGKPVYEKTFNISTIQLSSNQWSTISSINCSELGVDKIVNSRFLDISQSASTNRDYIGASYNINTSEYLRVYNVSAYSVDVNICILQYTKTTD